MYHAGFVTRKKNIDHLVLLRSHPRQEEIRGTPKFFLTTFPPFVTIGAKLKKGGDSMAAINLRDVPEELHRALKVRAAQRGIKLYALVLEYLEEGLKKDKEKKGGAYAEE